MTLSGWICLLVVFCLGWYAAYEAGYARGRR